MSELSVESSSSTLISLRYLASSHDFSFIILSIINIVVDLSSSAFENVCDN